MLGTAAPDPADHSRILASLEHGSGARAAPRPGDADADAGIVHARSLAWALALMLLLALLGWWASRDAAGPADHGANAAPPANAAPQGAAAAPPQAPAPAPAAIITDIAAPPALASSPALAAGMGAAAPQPAPAAAPPSTPRAVAVPAHRVAANARPAPPGPLRKARQSVPAAAADSDVVLLTALVAHANSGRAASESNRDVMLRKDSDSTATLLQRCKQLGMIEGMLCRSRICAGSWDSDLACQ